MWSYTSKRNGFQTGPSLGLICDALLWRKYRRWRNKTMPELIEQNHRTEKMGEIFGILSRIPTSPPSVHATFSQIPDPRSSRSGIGFKIQNKKLGPKRKHGGLWNTAGCCCRTVQHKYCHTICGWSTKMTPVYTALKEADFNTFTTSVFDLDLDLQVVSTLWSRS